MSNKSLKVNRTLNNKLVTVSVPLRSMKYQYILVSIE